MDLLAVEIDSIVHETAVSSLVDLLAHSTEQRELQLVQTADMIYRHLDTPAKLASFAAMAVVMLAEERKKNEGDHRRDLPRRVRRD